MENTMLIHVTDQKAFGFLYQLEKLHFIKVLEKTTTPPLTKKLSEKYKGIISKEQGHALNEHVKQMRNEWNSI